MNFSPSDTISYKVVLADIVGRLDDDGYRKFHKGTYMSLIQQALEQLSIESKVFIVDHYANIDNSLTVPHNTFNLKEAFIYNGDCCNINTCQKLWLKDGYRTKGLTQGYVANVKDNTTDPFMPSFPNANSVFFYGIDNGMLYLSPSCSGYNKVLLRFNVNVVGLGEDINIPIQFRQAVVDWVTHELLGRMAGRDPRVYATLYDRANNNLYDRINGSWIKALRWCNELDSADRESLLEYMSKAND